MDCSQIFDSLKCSGFPARNFRRLGRQLGLLDPTLDTIEMDKMGDPDESLRECLSKWLDRVDNVDFRGGATIDSLSNALKTMGETAVANKIDQKTEVKFVLNCTFHTLDEVQELLKTSFNHLNKKIVICQDTCILDQGIVSGLAPLHLRAALVLEAQDNLTVLKKEFSLIKLTIDDYTLYDKGIRYKVMNDDYLAEEIELADREEVLRTLLDYKEGSIFEQDKQLNIIKKREEYIQRILQTPGFKLKVELLTREKLTSRRKRLMLSEIEHLYATLRIRAGRKEKLVEYKKEIELLQEDISVTSVQLLKNQKENIDGKDCCTMTDDKSLLFKSKCEGLRIFCHVTDATCYKSGLRVILDIQSAKENKKAIIFLDSVEENPMLLQGMRQYTLGHENKRTGDIKCNEWVVFSDYSDKIGYGPAIADFHNYGFHNCSPDSFYHLLPILLQSNEVKKLTIRYSPLVLEYLESIFASSDSLDSIEHLYIYCSISDEGLAALCYYLSNSTSSITHLWLDNNDHITSQSSAALCNLLLHNRTLSMLSLVGTSLDSMGIEAILNTLCSASTKLEELVLDAKHEERFSRYNIGTCKISYM